MRVISGKYGGRILKYPKSKDIRPLQDRAKEALFQILDVENKTLLDAYAGSGQLGIEALSRGASHVTLVDRDKEAIKVIKENLNSVGITDRTVVIVGSIEQFIRRNEQKFDVVIANPPFAKIDTKIIEQLFCSLNVGGVLIFIHSTRDKYDLKYGEKFDERVYGDNKLVFIRRLTDDNKPLE